MPQHPNASGETDLRTFVLLILVCALLASSAPAAVAAVADTTESGDLWLEPDLVLHPRAPCYGDEVIAYLRGYVSTPCDSFIGVSHTDGQPIIVRTLLRTDRQCAVGPSVFFAIPVSLGRPVAGSYSFVVQRRRLMLDANGALDSTSTESIYDYVVRSDCPLVPQPWVTELSYVDTALTLPSQPCPGQPLTFEMAGHFLDGCGRVESATASAPSHASLILAPYPQVRMPCTANLKPWKASFPLGPLVPAGQTIWIDLKIRGTNAFWPPTADRVEYGYFTFPISTTCDSLPPGPLPFVDRIDVMPKEICVMPGRTLCPVDSILVGITGRFPGFCCAQPPRIELVPDLSAAPQLPQPPIVRIVVDYDIMVRCACSALLEPFFGTVTLPPLPARTYNLRVELLQRGGGRDSTLDATTVPFQVVSAESCGAGAICLTPRWMHPLTEGCDAYVSTTQSGTVTLGVSTKVALSGLQGRLRFWESGLAVLGIEPVGVAAGMHLNWTRTFDGARFVMFAESGAPIPPGGATPILAVTVQAMALVGIGDYPPPLGEPVFHLAAEEMLGADESGNGVPSCLPPPCVDMRMMPDVAVICREQACDFNADGLTDVRDIVLMARCAFQTGPCPPDVETRFDCDGSGTFGLVDVVCCAMHMLRAPGCPNCPPDSIRPEPGVAIRFGAPGLIPGGVQVPFGFEGLDRVGAARLRLRFPADRYTAQVEGSASMFYVQEVEGDVLTLGLIGGMPLPSPIVDPAPIIDPGPLRVRLLLRPGHTPGGELRLEGGQLSGPDGVLLAVDLGAPSVPLGGGSFEVSKLRPNPFSTSTRFSIVLEAPGRLDVSVHDVSGRRLASLFHGTRDAGLQEFVWDGRRDDGSQVSNGVYFVRVNLDGRALSRSVVLLRGRGPATRVYMPNP